MEGQKGKRIIEVAFQHSKLTHFIPKISYWMDKLMNRNKYAKLMEGQKGKRIIEVAFQSWHTLLQTKVNKKIDEYRFINRKIYAN